MGKHHGKTIILVVDARIQAEGQLDSPRLDEPENETPGERLS